MKKALLSLWLLGAPTYTANVVILSRSPSGSGGAVAECVEPKEPPINVTDVAKTVRPTEAGPAKTEQTGTANESSSAPTADRSAAADSPAATPPKDSTHYDWAEIQRSGAYVHSESSVNAAVISILPVGKQLRILAYRNVGFSCKTRPDRSVGFTNNTWRRAETRGLRAATSASRRSRRGTISRSGSAAEG